MVLTTAWVIEAALLKMTLFLCFFGNCLGTDLRDFANFDAQIVHYLIYFKTLPTRRQIFSC